MTVTNRMRFAPPSFWVWGLKLGVVTVVCFALVRQSRGEDSEEPMLKKCEAMMPRVATTTDVDLLYTCANFYWHHPQFDRTPAYAKEIKIYRRLLEVDPSNIDNYSLLSWFLWSDWVTWKKDPKKMPGGKNLAAEAVKVLENGAKVHPKDGDYYYKAAQIIEPLARHYLPEDYAFVIKNYLLADQFANRAYLKTQSRLFIACIYRDQKKPKQAVAWYRKVLEVDPQNRDALLNLKELGTAAK